MLELDAGRYCEAVILLLYRIRRVPICAVLVLFNASGTEYIHVGLLERYV
jgi:hypothetical protein